MLIDHRHRSREALLFSAATAIAVVHALDDAFFGRQAGVANDRFAAAAGPRSAHWNIADAKHTGAVRSHRPAYERRVSAFFDRALLEPQRRWGRASAR